MDACGTRVGLQGRPEPQPGFPSPAPCTMIHILPGMKRLFEFGPYRLDADDRLLYRDSTLLPLPPKAIDTLLALVGNHDRVVEKEELLKAVWPDTFVEEGGLARNISILRKALGDDGGEARYIETIPKRGYRFVSPVTEVVPNGAAGAGPAPRRHPALRWLVPAGAAILLALVLAVLFRDRLGFPTHIHPRRVGSIAVLPARNLANDPSQDYFPAGMTDEIKTKLTKIRDLRVIAVPATAGRTVAEFLKDQDVDAVLEVSVLRDGDRVRTTAQLGDARSGELFWAEHYDRPVADTLALQTEVATAIAREIRSQLSPEEARLLSRSHPVGSEAFNLYLQGRYAWNRRTEDGLRRAIGYFEQCARADPRFPLAYAGLADAYALLGSTGYDALPPAKAMPLAREAASKALALDPTLAEARTTLAYIAMAYDWDLNLADTHFRAALDLNPSYATAHHWYAHYWIAAGRPDRALEEMKRALDLEPSSLAIMVGVGWAHYFARNYDAAIAQYRRTLELEPHFALAHQTLGMAYEQKRMHAEALAEFEKAAEYSGGSASTVAALAAAYAASGNRTRTEEQLGRLRRMAQERYVPAVLFANVAASMKDAPALQQWLGKAVAERSEYLIYLRADPSLDSYRRDPLFARFLDSLPLARTR